MRHTVILLMAAMACSACGQREEGESGVEALGAQLPETLPAELVSSDPNEFIVKTTVTGCRRGLDPVTQQDVQACDVCVVYIEPLLYEGSTRLAMLRRVGTVAFRYAMSEEQPNFSPARGESGVWALDRTSINLRNIPGASFGVGAAYRSLSGMEAAGSMTPSGSYYLPPHVRQSLEQSSEQEAINLLLRIGGDCPLSQDNPSIP